MSAKQILVVEDERPIREMIAFGLRRAGFEVREAADARSGRAEVANKLPDLLLVDWMLPDTSGLEFTRALKRDRETRELPIIMLTARAEEGDKVAGLEGGADDYITKPFSMRELLARVNAHLRRVASFEASDEEVFDDGSLRVDRGRFEARLGGERVHLTKKEFDLLWLLIRNRGRVVTRDAILARLWDYDADVETRTVDVHIRSLRRKLGEERIETVVGLGYRYQESGASGTA
jgi:DNA-binding response OmpR family regulator